MTHNSLASASQPDTLQAANRVIEMMPLRELPKANHEAAEAPPAHTQIDAISEKFSLGRFDSGCAIDGASNDLSVVLWAVAPVAPLHLGFDRPIQIIRELLAAKVRVRVLLADMHASLGYGLGSQDVRRRTTYYYNYLTYACGEELEIVEGSEFQMRPDYVKLLFELQRFANISAVKEALPLAISKNNHDNQMVSTLNYTMMQIVDPFYLQVDAVLASRGQQKVHKLGPTLLQRWYSSLSPALGKIQARYPTQLYYDLSVDIKGKPLNQSYAASRISMHETEATLERKVRAVYAPPAGQQGDPGRVNALLEIYRYSVFPWISEPIALDCQDGRVRAYKSAEAFELDYLEGLLHPSACKSALMSCLSARLRNVQEALGKTAMSWVDITRIG